MHNLQCSRLDGADASVLASDTMLVKTCVHEIHQELNPDCVTDSGSGSDSLACEKLWHGTQEKQSYIGDIEHFTVLVGHTLQLGRQSVPSSEMRGGKLEVACGSKGCSEGQQWICHTHPHASTSPIVGDGFCRIHPDAEGCSHEAIRAALTNSTPCFVPPTGSVQGNEFFQLQFIVRATGVTLNDEHESRGMVTGHRHPGGCGHGTYRGTGMVLNLAIVYSNVKQLGIGTAPPWYVYRASKIDDAYQRTQIVRNTSLTRLRQSTHGVLIIAQAQGRIGEYSLHTTLVSVATGSTLVGVVALCVKLMAIHLMADKQEFKRATEKHVKKESSMYSFQEPLIQAMEVGGSSDNPP